MIITLLYRLVPQKVIVAKANKYVGNDIRAAKQMAKRKGETREPIFTYSSGSMSTAYYANQEIDEIALNLTKEYLAKKEAEKQDQLHAQAQFNALTNVHNVVNAKLKQQGIHNYFRASIV